MTVILTINSERYFHHEEHEVIEDKEKILRGELLTLRKNEKI